MTLRWLRGSFYLGRDDTGGTVTGRLSSNLQQIPRQSKDTPAHLRMKDTVVAPPGFMLLEADYSQIELRIAAWLANEPTMRRIYQQGGDIHADTARDILRTGATPDARQKAKSVNFGFLYGMGAAKFVIYAFVTYGVRFTDDEAQTIRKRFFRKFSALSAWYMRQEAEVRRTRQVRTPLGRIRHLPDILSPDKEVQQSAVRRAINMPVQATASDLNLLAAIEAEREMPAGTKFLLPYHDATVWLVPEAEIEPAARLLKRTMEDTVPNTILPQKFRVTCPVPLEAEVKVGRSWGSMEVVKGA